jgi:putative flippase GtrA
MLQKLSGELKNGRLVRFIIVGVVSAAVQFLILSLIGSTGRAEVAFTVAFACSTLTHYLLNKHWALPCERTDTLRQGLEYLATVAISYGINLAAFSFFHRALELDLAWAGICAIPPSTVVVFLVLNFRVFRKKTR